MADLFLDLRLSLRSLLRRPLFLVGTAGILALGMGAALALFTVLDGVRIRPLPVADPEGLMVMVGDPLPGAPRRAIPQVPLPWPVFEAHRQGNPAFQDLALFEGRSVFLGDKATGTTTPAAFVSGAYFRTLGLRASAGRLLAPEEQDAAVARVILGHGTWIRHFGGDPALIGREVLVDGRACLVVGVAPRGFSGLVPDKPEGLWITLGALDRYDSPDQPGFRSGERRSKGVDINVVGRLKPGLTRAQAAALTDACATRMAGGPVGFSREVRTVISPLSRLQDVALETFLPHPGLLFTAVALCLLLACLVVTNLQLAHQERLRREHATRLALGGSTLQLARRILVEHLWLAGLGASGAWILARLALLILPRLDPRTPFTLLDLPALRPPVLAFLAGLTLLLAVLTTLMPLLQLRRQRPMNVMKEGAATSRSGLRGTLVVLQVALCLSLVGPIAGVVQTLRKTLAEQTALGRENVELRFDVPADLRTQTPALLRRLLEEAKALPGSLGAATGGSSGTGHLSSDGIAQLGMWVSEGYFHARDLAFIEGRDFAPGESQEVVLGQAVARSLFPGTSALGKSLDGRTVVGVVKDEPIPLPFPAGMIYTRITDEQLHTAYPIFVRSSGQALSLVPAVRDLLERVVPGAQHVRIETHVQAVSRELAAPVMAVTLLGFLGGLALLLAILGIYSMLTFLAAQRTREVGLRMALGARPLRIVREFLGQGARLLGLGATLGTLGALAVYHLMGRLLWGLRSARSGDYTLGFGLLLIAALLASLLPALRAARVAPAEALRAE